MALADGDQPPKNYQRTIKEVTSSKEVKEVLKCLKESLKITTKLCSADPAHPLNFFDPNCLILGQFRRDLKGLSSSFRISFNEASSMGL